MKKTICIILIVAFAALFCTSAYFIYDHYRQDKQQAELYDSLAELVDSAAETEEEPTEPILYTEEKTVLPELAELYQQNSDLAGWIRIEDTNINYPVMYTPDNPDFYLKHGFDNQYQFMNDEDNDVESEITVSFTEAALGCEKLLKFDGARSDTLSVKIPAGISEGQSIRLQGKGRTGYSGQKGNLFLKVHIKNDTHYTREGQDVYITQDVPYTTAILGGEAEFETLYGPVRCKVPAGSQAGSKLRLRNKGIVSMKDKNRYGDEYVILKISVPKQVSEQERELLQKLKNIEERKPA